MVDKGDDDHYIQEFMARAKKRQAKLAQIDEREDLASRTDEEEDEGGDVSYPPLSPLPEEDNEGSETSAENDQHEEESLTEENISTVESGLNYSSDLSIECDDGVYRAEPIHCNSSPEHYRAYPQPRQISPRKQVPSISQQHHYHPAQAEPLQELQLPEQKAASSTQSLPEMSSTEQSLKDLKLKVDRAEQTRNQLKKVVELSKYGSKEHVEAARLLQITELEHLNYTNQMALFKEGSRKQSESLGSSELSNLKIKISSKLKSDLAETGISHYFFCVASCGMDVKATEIIDTNDIRRQDLKAYVQFKDMISFADLPPNFVIKIEVFELVTGQHLPKLLSRLTPSKKSKITPQSHFKRVGSLKLTLSDRQVNSKNLTQWSKHEESKYIERECKFELKLKPEQMPCKLGMLHVRFLDNQNRPDWCRYFVDLSDRQIRFWKSKQDALDDKKPNQILELNDLCSEKVQILNPDDGLYRQHSFVIFSLQQVVGGEKNNLFQRVLKDDHKFKIVKHQLAAENKEERDSWCSILDKSMHCFREWHGRCKVYEKSELEEIFTSLD